MREREREGVVKLTGLSHPTRLRITRDNHNYKLLGEEGREGVREGEREGGRE